MRTGENDKLDAKHNAGVGPGNSANEANLAAFFSLSSTRFIRHFLLSPFFSSFFFSFTFVRCQNRMSLPCSFTRESDEISKKSMRIFVFSNNFAPFRNVRDWYLDRRC